MHWLGKMGGRQVGQKQLQRVAVSWQIAALQTMLVTERQALCHSLHGWLNLDLPGWQLADLVTSCLML